MAEAPRPRRQKAICAICNELIREGEGVRRITLPCYSVALPTHPNCYDRDWETIESGLEPFPILPKPGAPAHKDLRDRSHQLLPP
jgi:hypothetical protein